jgi:hypothetical protein
MSKSKSSLWAGNYSIRFLQEQIRFLLPLKGLMNVLTMNPNQDGFKSRASTSPALFNRCVVNWFGDWSNRAYYQLGEELTANVDLEKADYTAPENFNLFLFDNVAHLSHRDAVVNTRVITPSKSSLTKERSTHHFDYAATLLGLYKPLC